MKQWSRALSYFRPEKAKIFAAVGLMAASIAANLAKPWPIALIVDSLFGNKPLPDWIPNSFVSLETAAQIAVFAVLIFVLHTLGGVLAAWQNYLSINIGLRGLSRLRNELFAWMQRLSLAFYQRTNQGDLIYRATWDTYSLQTLFQQGLFKFLNALASVLLMLVIMWQLNPRLMLITLALFPPLILAMYFFGSTMNRQSLAAHQADSAVTSLVQQNITSLPVIQSYTREKLEEQRFGLQVEEAFGKRKRQHGWEVVYWLAIAVLFGLATALLTWWGSREILAQRLSIGELLVFLSYLGQLYDPLNQLSHVGATVSDANAGLHRIFEVLDTPESLPQKPNPKSISQCGKNRGISFENVRFGYEPGKPVLHDLSFEVKQGEIVGIVGPSGSGKTTLLNLIPRFFDPDKGVVRLGPCDLRDLSLEELRQNIACVFQESFLLPATIAENISAEGKNCSADELEEAARLAGAHEFIARLPNGYQTIVGEGAARLSVGEKQRISIARAFLKNAPILLLDEPTSSLDADTELAVVESLTRLLQNRTVLMAAHRLTTLRRVDRIVVLDSGRILETGTPSELISRNGYFARVSRSNSGRI